MAAFRNHLVWLLAEWVWPHVAWPFFSSWLAVMEKRWRNSSLYYSYPSTPYWVRLDVFISEGSWGAALEKSQILRGAGGRGPPLGSIAPLGIWQPEPLKLGLHICTCAIS